MSRVRAYKINISPNFRFIYGLSACSCKRVSWNIHHFHLCVIKPGHNRSIILYGSFLTRLESFGSISHVVTCLVCQPKFLTLHDVTCKVYRVFLSTLQTLLAAPQDVTQFVVAKLKPLWQLQRAKELVKQSADGGFDFLPQRAFALTELLKRLLCQPAEQLVNSGSSVLLVTLGSLSVLGGIIDKGTTCCVVNTFLQVVTQMLIGLVKELVIAFFTHKFTQPLMGNGLMAHTGLHIVNIPVVRQNDIHLTCGCVIPAFRLAPTLLHRCIGVCYFVYVLNDIDVRVQFLTHLLSGTAHHVAVFLHGTILLYVIVIFTITIHVSVLCDFAIFFVGKLYALCRFNRSIHFGIFGFFLCHFRFHQFLILGKFLFGLLQLVGILKRFAVTRLHLLQLAFVSFCVSIGILCLFAEIITAQHVFDNVIQCRLQTLTIYWHIFKSEFGA